MAITKDFKIKLSVENKADKSFKSVEETASAANVDVKSLQASFKALADAAEVITSQLKNLDTGYKSAAKEASTFEESLASQSKLIKSEVDLFNELTGTLGGTTQNVGELAQSFDKLTDPKTLINLTGMLNSMSQMEKVKGNTVLAENFKVMAERAQELNLNIQKFNESAQKDFERAQKKAELLETAMNGLEKVGLAVGAAFAISGAIKLGEQFDATRAAAQGLKGGLVQASENVLGLAGVSKDALKPSLIGIAEAAHFVTPALFFLGSEMLKSDNIFIKFTGTAAIVASVLIGGIGAAVIYVSHLIANLAIAIGDKLINSMIEFEKKAQSLDSALNSFMFTVRGFNREFGEESTGSLEHWNKLMDEVYNTTIYTQEEISKAMKLMIAEGSAIGLTVKESTALLSRATDIASQNGEKLEDIVLRLIQGLTGNSAAVLNLGIDLRETSLAHAQYLQAAGKTVDFLTEFEKKQLRLQKVMERTQPIVGYAANQMNTLAGATANLNKHYEMLEIRIGKQGELTKALVQIETNLIKAFTDLPEPIIRTIGVMQDFMGVTLKILGTIMKYALTIAGIATLHQVLSATILGSATAQGILTTAFTLLGTVMNAHFIPVTTVTALYTNLAVAARALAGAIMSSLVAALRFLGVVLGRIAMFLIPLAIKLGAIVTVVYAAYQAFIDLTEKTLFFKRILDFVTKALSVFTPGVSKATEKVNFFAMTMQALANAGMIVFNFLKNLGTLILTGLGGAVTSLAIAFLYVKKAFLTGKEADMIQEDINHMTIEFLQLGGEAYKAAGGLSRFMSQTAYASEEVKKATESIDIMGKKAKGTADELARMVAINLKDFDKVNERLKVMGTEFDKARIKQLEAQKALAKAQAMNEDLGEKAKAIAEKTKEAFIADIEVQKLRMDTIKGIGDETNKMNTEALKNAGLVTDSIHAEYTERRRVFEKTVADLRSLGKISDKETQKINAFRQALYLGEVAEINAEKIKKLKDMYGDLSDEIRKISERTAEVVEQYSKQDLSARGIIDLEFKKNKAIVDTLENQLRLTKQLTPENEKILEGYRDAIKTLQEYKKEQAGFGTVTLGESFDEVSAKFNEISEVLANLSIDQLKADVADTLEVLKGAGGGSEVMGAVAAVGSTAADTGKAIGDAFAKQVSSITWEDVGKVLYYGIKAGVDLFAGIFSGQLINDLAGGFDFIADLPDALFKAFENLGTILNKFMTSFPSLVQKFVQALPGMITKIVDALPLVVQAIVKAIPKIIEAILAALPKLVNGIADALPQLITALLKGFESFIQKLPDILRPLIQALPQIVASILNRLPGIIKALFEAIPKIIKDLFAAIPGIIIAILEALPDILSSLIEGIISAIGAIVLAFIDEFILKGGIIKIIAGIIKAVPRIVWALVTGIAKGLMNIFAGLGDMLFGNVELPDAITDLPDKIADGAKDLGKDIAREASQIFSVKDLGDSFKFTKDNPTVIAFERGSEIIEKKWKGLLAMLKQAWTWIADTILKPIFKAFVDVFMWVFDHIFKPIFEGIGAIFNFVFNNFLKPFIDGVFAVFKTIIDVLMRTFQYIGTGLKAAWQGLKDAGTFVVNIFKSMWGFVKGIFQGVIDTFRALWNFVSTIFTDPIAAFKGLWEDLKNIFINAITNFGNFFKNIGNSFLEYGGKIWQGLKDGLASAGDFLGDIGKTIWNGLKAGISGAFDFFADLGKKMWDGLVSGFEKFGSFVEKLFSFKQTPPGTVEKWLGINIPMLTFAQGGMVPGYAPKPGDDKRNDIVPALLSPGEMVMPRSIVDDPTHRKVLEAMLTGQDVARLYSWDDFKNDAKSTVSTVKSAGEGVGDYIADTASAAGNASVDFFKKLGQGDFGGAVGSLGDLATAGVPQYIKDLYNSIRRFTDNINLKNLISNPTKELTSVVKSIGETLITNPIAALMKGNKFADGGLVGGFGSNDTVPAFLMPGEFVMNRDATRENLPLLKNMNQGGMANFGGGGGGIVINKIEINAKTNLDADQIRREVIPAIKESIKRDSQLGKFVVATTGIRSK